MYTGILHTHTLVVSLYLILLLIKTILLFAGKKERLSKFRSSTKVPEMVLATLFLLTGIYLGFQSGAIYGGYWFIVKLVLIVAIIVLGVLSFKKESRIMALINLILFLYVFGISETKSLDFNADYQTLYGKKVSEKKDWNPDSGGYDINAHGKLVYQKNCVACHGENGKLGKSGSKNLQKSELSIKETYHIVRNGKNSMPAYEEALTEQEIKAVAHYVHKLSR